MIQATARAGTFVHVFEEPHYEHIIFSALVWLAPGAEVTLEQTR